MKYFSLLLTICVVSTLGKVIYVDSTAAAGGNGQPSSPYNTIGSAVSALADGDQISIAFGYYTVSDMTITNQNVDFYAPNGAYVTCDSGASLPFIFSSASGISIRNLWFSKCITSIMSFMGSTGSIQGCKFYNNSGITTVGVLQLRSGSKVNIESTSFSYNTITAVLVASSCTANITNSFFNGNSGSTSQAGGITLSSNTTVSVSSSKFILNSLAIYAPASNIVLNIFNNNFYSNYKQPTNNSITCNSPTLSQSGNTFCGYLGAGVSCGSWTPTYTAADSCGICNGNNTDKDCNGVCFGNATGTCPSPKTIWVAPGGNGTQDGSSKSNAMATIQAAINSASYGDTVKLVEGSYSGTGNYNIDTKGKAITIISEYGQPERTIITCASQYSDIGIISNTGESYDTIIKGITITGCVYGAQVTGTSPTFISVIFSTNFAAGAYLTGSCSSLTDCDFSTNGQASISALSGLYSLTTSEYYAFNKVKYCRFSNNLNYRAGGLFVGNSVNMNVDSSFFIQNKIYTGQNGFSIYADALSKLNVYNTSINTNITSGNSIYCVPSSTTINQTANTFCGLNGNTLSCSQWGTATSLVADVCGVCGGTNATRDCNNTCFGRSESDSAGGCCLYWQKDCNMICNGNATYDDFGTCCVFPKTIDCTGTCGGTFKKDKNQVCCNATLIDNNNVCCTNGTIDCNGICNGGWVDDTQGQCCPVAWKDYCGICNGTNDSCQTCAKSCLNGGTCNNTIQSCACTGGYYGEQCEQFSCPAGCHGGTCIAPNMCNCNGTNGSPPNCLPTVSCGNITCYNNGTCSGSDACDCTGANGYFGPNCVNYTCDTTCKNSGVCIGPNLCDCSNSNGFFGNLCDQFSCPNGCDNGVCTGPNTCSCLQGWSGPTCSSEQGVSSSTLVAPIVILLVLALSSLSVL